MNVKDLYESVKGETGRIAVNESSGTISVTVPKSKAEVYRITDKTETVKVNDVETAQPVIEKV